MKPFYEDEYVQIWHGDATEAVSVLPQNAAIISDPPYGMNYDTNGRRFTRGGRSLPSVFGDNKNFDPLPWLNYSYCVLWGFNHFPANLPNGGALIWIKRSDAAFGCFLSDAEIAWVKGSQGVYAFRNTHHAIAAIRQHPTEKPLDLMVWSILKSGAPENAVIVDPYCGSGTTLRAAKDLGRKAIGIEIEERYCEIAAKRCNEAQPSMYRLLEVRESQGALING
jgi:site-specific DNA-methyltransferase (adenine-specific)